MCKVRKIHLLAINGLMWTAIGTKISITGIGHYLTTPTEKLWRMIPLSVLVFAGSIWDWAPACYRPESVF